MLGFLEVSGKLDLVVANRITGTNVQVLIGNGDGTFKAPVGYVAGMLPNSVAVGDFNGDHILDLATANSGESTVSLFTGNGDGTFKPAGTFSVADLPWHISAADFDGDGNLDLATANAGTAFGTTVSVLRGNGKGQFAAPVNYVTGQNTHTVLVGDFDMNGKPDLAVVNTFDNTVTVLLNAH
jgi:hypothetical protein